MMLEDLSEYERELSMDIFANFMHRRSMMAHCTRGIHFYNGRRVARRTQVRRCFHIILQKKKRKKKGKEKQEEA